MEDKNKYPGWELWRKGIWTYASVARRFMGVEEPDPATFKRNYSLRKKSSVNLEESISANVTPNKEKFVNTASKMTRSSSRINKQPEQNFNSIKNYGVLTTKGSDAIQGGNLPQQNLEESFAKSENICSDLEIGLIQDLKKTLKDMSPEKLVPYQENLKSDSKIYLKKY